MNPIPLFLRRAAVLALLLLVPATLSAAEPAVSAQPLFFPFVASRPGVIIVADEAELRAAIETANAAAQMPRIELAADIELDAGETAEPLPAFDNPRAGMVIIAGGGHVLSGNAAGSVLSVRPETAAAVERLTISGGVNEGGCGGGIHNKGSLTLRQSRVTGNRAGRGGGICVLSRGAKVALRLEQTVVEANTAGEGGGLYALAEDNGWVELSILDSTLTRNRAKGGHGGGIYILAREGDAFSEITRSAVTFNAAVGVAGLFHSGTEVGWPSEQGGGYAWATIRNSTFSGNVSLGDGGAIGNFSYEPYDGAGAGRQDPAAPRVPPLGFGQIRMFNSTVSGNWAARGSGVFAQERFDVIVYGSIIAGNEATGRDCWGGVDSEGYNLDGDNSCGLDQPTDLPGGRAGLLPLALNPPGTTSTHALGPDSQARDRIPIGQTGCNPAADTDQRGVARPQPAGGLCDIGAYEAER